MIVTLVDVVTVPVFAVNVAEVEPAATVTDVGTVADEVLLLDRLTSAPPEGAALVKVTVPCDVPPLVTDVGFTLTPDSAAGAGCTVNTAVVLTEL